MILTFEDTEDEAINSVLSAIDKEVKNLNMSKTDGKHYLKFTGLDIDIPRRLVIRNNMEIQLTNIEFEILILLAENAGVVFSKEQIYDIVWQEPYSGDYNIVMSHIRHIREKIEDNPGKPLYIQTVWGIGYRFNKNLSSSL